ncbi:MAG: lysozyme inhibitor LprI family protein [Pseudomonadota bacterium]
MTRAALLAFAILAAPASAGATGSIVERLDACLGAVGAPGAHPEQCMGLHAEPCMERAEGQTTYGMVTCLSEETAAWDEILNREYKALVAALDTAQTEALREAQRAWLDFRDADCAFPHVFVEGSLARPWGADCVMQHTARRAVELRGYRDFLE